MAVSRRPRLNGVARDCQNIADVDGLHRAFARGALNDWLRQPRRTAVAIVAHRVARKRNMNCNGARTGVEELRQVAHLECRGIAGRLLAAVAHELGESGCIEPRRFVDRRAQFSDLVAKHRLLRIAQLVEVRRREATVVAAAAAAVDRSNQLVESTRDELVDAAMIAAPVIRAVVLLRPRAVVLLPKEDGLLQLDQAFPHRVRNTKRVLDRVQDLLHDVAAELRQRMNDLPGRAAHRLPDVARDLRDGAWNENAVEQVSFRDCLADGAGIPPAGAGDNVRDNVEAGLNDGIDHGINDLARRNGFRQHRLENDLGGLFVDFDAAELDHAHPVVLLNRAGKPDDVVDRAAGGGIQRVPCFAARVGLELVDDIERLLLHGIDGDLGAALADVGALRDTINDAASLRGQAIQRLLRGAVRELPLVQNATGERLRVRGQPVDDLLPRAAQDRCLVDRAAHDLLDDPGIVRANWYAGNRSGEHDGIDRGIDVVGHGRDRQGD